MARTPFMNLDLLEREGFTLSNLISQINDSFNKIDSHNHTSGSGTEVPLSSIVADSSLNINQNSVINLAFLSFINRVNSVSQNNTLFFKNGELFVRDGSGREIQLSFEGGLAQSMPGKVRGRLIATSANLATSGASVNTDILMNLNIADGLPEDKYSRGVTAGVLFDDTSVVIDSQFGYVIDAEVGGEIKSSVVIPYGNIQKSIADHSNQDTEFQLRVSSSQAIGIEYRRGVTDRINFQFLSATLPSDTYVKIYEAVVRGAPGPQGIQGVAGPTGNALTQAQRDTLEKAVEVDSITLNDNDLFFASNSGRATTINLDNVASEINPVTVRNKLQELTGDDRLDASAVKDLPAGSFSGLSDTPSSIEANKFVKSNAGGSALEYADPPVDTASQIRDKLVSLKTPNKLPASAIENLPEGSLIGLDSLPSDLSNLSNGQVLWINGTPRGQWREVQGANDTERHSFGADFVADPANPARNTWLVGTQLSYGVSFTTSRYGNEYTADRGRAFTPDNAPVRSMIIELMVTRLPATGVHLSFSSSATVTIPRSDLPTAPNRLWFRYYSGPPSADNEVATVEFVKSADNPAHNYHTYTEQTPDAVPSDVSDILSIRYFNIFTASPATDDQTSNPLQLHEAKTTVPIDEPQSGPELVAKLSALQSGARLPASAIRDLPTGGASVADTESVITPSLATGDYSSETIIGLASSSIDSEQGITLSNNRITFSKAGTYIITSGFEVVSSGGADAGGQRTMAHVRLKKNGVDDESMEAEAYIRYSDTTHGNLITPFELSLSGALKVEANDYIEFYLQTYNQTTATRHSIVASESSIKINRASVGGSGGGGGVSHFSSLTDTPNSYSGQRGKVVQVNASETGLEFLDKQGGPDFKTGLEALSGNQRLNASAVQGLPTPETGATIKGKLEGLSGSARLNASAVQGLTQRSDSDINTLIEAKVENFAEVGQNAIAPVSRLGTVLTQAQYNALQTKANQLYFVTE